MPRGTWVGWRLDDDTCHVVVFLRIKIVHTHSEVFPLRYPGLPDRRERVQRTIEDALADVIDPTNALQDICRWNPSVRHSKMRLIAITGSHSIDQAISDIGGLYAIYMVEAIELSLHLKHGFCEELALTEGGKFTMYVLEMLLHTLGLHG
ncbi:hypothetical protein D3C78_1345700 [compost metagenome]